MTKVFEQKLIKIKSNVDRWYKYFGANIYVNILGRKLYQYPGASDRTSIRSIFAKQHETEVIDSTSRWSSLGLRSPYNLPTFGNEGALMERAKDLMQHFNMPVYHNLIGSLHESIMGGLTKASIDVTVENMSSDYHTNFIKAQQKKIEKENLDPITAQQVNKIFENVLEEQELHSYDSNILASFLENNIQQFFDKIGNKEALMTCLDNLFTMGFSVLKLSVEKDIFDQTQIVLDPIEQPEKCFFSPLALKKDKSDGLFCGIIKMMDRKQIELMYDEELKQAQMPIVSLSNFTGSFFPFDQEYYFHSNDKNYLTVCEYYEKTKDGKIKVTMCCDNFVFEETILKECTTLPMLFLNSSLSNTYQTSGTFNKCFTVQKMYNEVEYKANKLTINTSTGKPLLPGSALDNHAYEELVKGAYNDSPALVYSAPPGISNAFDPLIMQGTDIPSNVLVRCDQLVQRMQFIISGIMSSEITKGGESSGAISGISRAIGSLNHNNLFAKQLNVFTNSLQLLVNSYLLMFYKVFSKSKNKKFDILTMKDENGKLQITEEIYKAALSDLTIKIFFSSDSSFNKEITRQSIVELLKINSNPILQQVLITAYCQNLEASNQGDLLNAINEANNIIAQQSQNPPPPDPALELEMNKLQADLINKEQERQFKAAEAEKDRQLEAYEAEKNRGFETWKIDTAGNLQLLTHELIHDSTITSNQIIKAAEGAALANKMSQIKKVNNGL